MEKATQITLAITIPLCFIAWFIMIGWMGSPGEFTLNINLTADDNVLEIAETAERMQNYNYLYNNTSNSSLDLTKVNNYNYTNCTLGSAETFMIDYQDFSILNSRGEIICERDKLLGKED